MSGGLGVAPPLSTRRTGGAHRPPPSPASSELDRLVLFVVAMGKQMAPALLEGLAETARASAGGLAESLLRAGSEARRAQVVLCFGESPAAASNLRQLLLEAGPVLRGELVRRLPRYLRALFSELRPGGVDAAPPATRALADRLLRLATH